MSTGWIAVGYNWYYMDCGGAMRTGWILDKGNWYYCYNDGRMASNVKIGSYKLGSNGVWVK